MLDDEELGLKYVGKPKRGRSLVILWAFILIVCCFLQTVFVAKCELAYDLILMIR